MAHTPTPWKPTKDRPRRIVSQHGVKVCTACYRAAPLNADINKTRKMEREANANAELIVRAVNAYEANEALIKEMANLLQEIEHGYAADYYRIHAVLRTAGERA